MRRASSRGAFVVVLGVALGAPSTTHAAPPPFSAIFATDEGDRVHVTRDAHAADGRAAEHAALEMSDVIRGDLALEDLSRPRRVGGASRAEANVTVGDESISVELTLFGAEGRVLLRKAYGGPARRAREIGHELVSEITVRLTGGRSIATTRILAVREQGARRELWLLDVAGGGATRVLDDGAITGAVSWSPDGGRVLYTSSVRRTPELFTLPVGGGRPEIVSRERGQNTDGRVSPDGRWVSVTLTRDGDSEIYLLDRTTSAFVRLTREWGRDAAAAWSPSGGELAFVSARGGGREELFVMKRDGREVRALTSLGKIVATPDWSPKGDLVVFAARDVHGASELWTVAPATGELVRLGPGGTDDFDPRFSPDGRHIVFASRRGAESDLWIMDVRGGGRRKITRGGGWSSPAWSPYLDETRDGQAVRTYLTSR